LVGAVALATDSGHVLVNKTRLQNALDAAALSAAISVNADPAKDTTKATTAGIATFDLFKGTSGNSELSKISLNASDFQYSKYLTPFTAGTNPPSFVRVSTRASRGSTSFLPVPPILTKVLGLGSQNVSAESTAGAVGNNCSLVPFVLCAKVSPVDTNCNDDTTTLTPIYDSKGNVIGYSVTVGPDGVKDCYGYNIGQKINMVQACNGNNSCDTDTSLETGNFNLLNVGDPGAKVIGEALRGTRNICGDLTDKLDTQPGYAVGQVHDGLRDRFESDSDQTEYTSGLTPANPKGASAYSQYKGNGQRAISVPIGDCTDLKTTGSSLIDKVGDGVGCVFLTKKPAKGGSDKEVMVEFVDYCQQNNTWSPTNATLNGPYKIVIFHTAGSQDS